jgi:hypothetical protein
MSRSKILLGSNYDAFVWVQVVPIMAAKPFSILVELSQDLEAAGSCTIISVPGVKQRGVLVFEVSNERKETQSIS